MEIQRREDTYRRASDELARRLVYLYDERIFPRQGRVFADMLFQTGIEAGSIVATIGEVDEKNAKIELANQALIKLTQTDYLLTVMHRAKFYETSQVEELELFVNALIKSIRDLLNTLYGPEASRFYTQMHPVNVPPVQPRTPAQPPQTPQTAPAPAQPRVGNTYGGNSTVINATPPQAVNTGAAPLTPNANGGNFNAATGNGVTPPANGNANNANGGQNG